MCCAAHEVVAELDKLRSLKADATTQQAVRVDDVHTAVYHCAAFGSGRRSERTLLVPLLCHHHAAVSLCIFSSQLRPSSLSQPSSASFYPLFLFHIFRSPSHRGVIWNSWPIMCKQSHAPFTTCGTLRPVRQFRPPVTQFHH